MKTPWWVSLASDHLVLPHQSVPEPLPTAKPTRGIGVLRTGRPGAPAMAVGITEHGWTTSAWLPYRVSAARTCSHIGVSFITAVEGHYPHAEAGLAAAAVPKPTVAQYAQYFRYLEVGVCANSSGPYGEALRPPGMVVYRNFPEK